MWGKVTFAQDFSHLGHLRPMLDYLTSNLDVSQISSFSLLLSWEENVMIYVLDPCQLCGKSKLNSCWLLASAWCSAWYSGTFALNQSIEKIPLLYLFLFCLLITNLYYSKRWIYINCHTNARWLKISYIHIYIFLSVGITTHIHSCF